jgi:hypothetical protein
VNSYSAKQFWVFVRLRHRLIWAHARTGSGKIALLFALYLLCGLIAFFFLLGGVGSAVAAIELGRGESLARWTLASLFVSGIGLSLLFGLGPREAFSDESLRRYPMNARSRFAVRHLIGLLDPTWLIILAGVFGLLIGFVFLRAGLSAGLSAGLIIAGLPAVVLFIISNYLTTAVLLALIGIILETRRGSALLGAGALLFVSIFPLIFSSLFAVMPIELGHALDGALRWTPPAAAAAMIAGESAGRMSAGASLLIIWCWVLSYLLIKIENRPRASHAALGGQIVWDDLYDQIGNLFGNEYGPLVSKSLRYHLRSNVIRFSLITSPFIVLLGKFMMSGQEPGGAFLITLSLFFMMAGATGANLMLNLFGFDRAGIRRYAVLPIQFAGALLAGSFASLMLRAVAVLAGFVIWLLSVGVNALIWPRAVMLVTTALAGLFLFNAIGLWTSVYSPKSVNFDAMWNNRLSFGANLVLICGMMAPFWLCLLLAEMMSMAALLEFWWVPGLVSMLSIGFYALSLRLIDRPLVRRREWLINLLAGARDK